jgi:hypothetical protein
VQNIVTHSPKSDRAEADFSDFEQGDTLLIPPFPQRDWGIVAGRYVWPLLIVTSGTSLQDFGRVRKGYEPDLAQLLCSVPDVQRFDGGIVRRFAGA